MEKKILIIDIESTNFKRRGGKIVEVGIVQLDLKTGDKKILFDEVCHQDGITKHEVMKSWIVKNSDLTMHMIQHSRNLKEMKSEIQQILNDHPLGCTSYNVPFDFGFMIFAGFRFPKKLDCPMLLSRELVQAKNKKGSLKNPNCMEAYHHFFPMSNYVEKHRAADDAWHEADIVYELYKRGIFKV